MGAKIVQFSAPMFLCSLHSSVYSHQELVPGLLKVGDLLRQSGTSEPVAASEFISSAVGEQVSREYSKAWCHSKNTHSEVKHAPSHLTFVKILLFFFCQSSSYSGSISATP